MNQKKKKKERMNKRYVVEWTERSARYGSFIHTVRSRLILCYEICLHCHVYSLIL
ncbi:unnamed protein product [Arabidopsis halleri]